MTDIQQAKRSLSRELRAVEGYIRVGIGIDGICLYADAETAPVVKVLHDKSGDTNKGLQVSIVLSEGFKAQPYGPEFGLSTTPSGTEDGNIET